MSLWNTTDEAASKPKYLSDADKAKTFGVDVAEVSAQRAVGVRSPGWVKYETYVDCNGNTRHRAESLVAASSMTLDAEDTVMTDVTIKITSHPLNVEVTEGETATFSVVATASPAGTPTYQWQSNAGGSWADLSGETTASLTTAATTLSDNGVKFRCVVSLANSRSVTSKPATLTVVAA